MKYLMVMIIAFFVPRQRLQKGECKEDKQKFCKDVVEAKGDVRSCMKQHEAELTPANDPPRSDKTHRTTVASA